jgi:type IV secretory pathway TraG/TraD family ATPase VirD4
MDRHRRGALIRSHRPFWKVGVDGLQPELGGVGVAPEDECKHFKFIGTTGTGKSTAIRSLLAHALARGDRAVVSDPDGSYAAEFLRPLRGDILLNPFESGSRRWDLFGELQDDYDVEQLVSALIVSSADSATQEWRGYARTLLGAVLRSCRQRSQHSLDELWRLLAVASHQELRRAVAGTPAQPFLEEHNSRMLGSIRSVMLSAMAALEHVRAQRAMPLSIRDWVQCGRGALFIPYRAGQIAALRGLIAAWLRLAIFEAMHGPAIDQRLWFFIDELDALGAIDGLKDALARLRKFGGRCVLGFQSIAQVSGTYGTAEAQTIIENCANTLILRCGGSENGGTSQFASRLIGEREVRRRQVSRSSDRGGGLGAGGARHSRQVVVQQVTESAVLASELEQLPDLAGYLKLASARGWQRVRLRRA